MVSGRDVGKGKQEEKQRSGDAPIERANEREARAAERVQREAAER